MNWRCGLFGALALIAGCAKAPEPSEPPFLWERQAGGVWCYPTIADPDCYPAPVPGEEDRLIASGPEIRFSWRVNPALEPELVPLSD